MGRLGGTERSVSFVVPPSHPSVQCRKSAMTSVSADSRPPLAGTRVLDLTWAMAGPYCTLLLGLLGADVIKVETARSLDGMRRGIYVVSEGVDASPTFNSLNLNKQGLRLNLKHPDGLAAFKELASVSDALVENFRPGVLDRMGIGYDTLFDYNPTIVVASSSAFGAQGPESRGAGYASIFNAMSSLGHLTGYIDGPPTELRDSIDLRVGTALAFAVLTALHHRQRTGEGQFIDNSSMEAVTSLVGHTVVGHELSGEAAQRQGNADDLMAPHGVYLCAGDDEWVSIAVGSDDEYQALCQTIGRPELATDPRLADGFLRKRNSALIDAAICAWTAQLGPTEVVEELQAAGVAAGPVLSNQAIVSDPHTIARETWREVDHPALGKRRVQRLPWKTSAAWQEVRGPAPLLGQHNDDILGGLLGIPHRSLRSMAEDGVFN